MIKRILYITFVDLDYKPTTGSTVRPIKIKEAFESCNIEVRSFGGAANFNKLSQRKAAVKKINAVLKKWRPDGCYIEPPTGPIFYVGDIILIKKLHKMNIPISIFYRDAYWKYPEYYISDHSSKVDIIKNYIIKLIQKRQWKLFNRYIDIIYFPSELMAKQFNCNKEGILPPGTFIPNMSDVSEKRMISKPLQFIFVGGAAKNYGTFLTLQSFQKVNQNKIVAKLFYICPEEQWKQLGIDKNKYKSWLSVIHISGDERLKYYYEQSDVAILTAPRTFYRDFAVPIKIYEYISYLKPVLVTDCTETANIIKNNNVGWVVKADYDDIAGKILYLCNHPSEITNLKDNIRVMRENNLWTKRVEKIINDLEKK